MTMAAEHVVHEMHLDALDGYAQAAGLTTERLPSGLKALPYLVKKKEGPKVLFQQSMGPPNLLVMPVARLFGWKVVYYFHEPTAFKHKLKNVSFIKSIAMQLVQWVDAHCASVILVSTDKMANQAAEVFKVSKKRMAFAPLLMPPSAGDYKDGGNRLTYLGRPDKMRYLQEFVDQADRWTAFGFRPTVLTGEPSKLYRAVGKDLPASLDVHAVRMFSEDMKAQILSETVALWNPKSGEITQSGVTADAVRYGIPIILTEFDPDFAMLKEKGLAVHMDDFSKQSLLAELIAVRKNPTEFEKLFSGRHGRDAFERSYLPCL